MLEPGDTVDGKYRVVKLLGVGGMGAVYEGQNLRINRRIAIKVMHATIAEQRDAVARFEREAQAAARIGSSHIVDVYDLGDLPSGERFMVMEFLEGESLLERFKTRGPMPATDAAHLVIQLLEGLARVHEAGIVHRDLKPANVFLARTHRGEESVKILDFGVCKILQDGKPGEAFTGVGDILGTPSYMSPEQLELGPHLLDARSDLYAVGILLYRALSGRLPYRANNLVELLMQLRARKAAPIADVVDVDPAFASIVTRATAWDRTQRYQTARVFQQALKSWLSGSRRVDHLLTDFLEVPGSIPAPSAPATAAPPPPAPARRVIPTAPLIRKIPASRLPPPRSPARRSPPVVAPPPDEIATTRVLLPPGDLPPRRAKKPIGSDEEETTVQKAEDLPKRPRR